MSKNSFRCSTLGTPIKFKHAVVLSNENQTQLYFPRTMKFNAFQCKEFKFDRESTVPKFNQTQNKFARTKCCNSSLDAVQKFFKYIVVLTIK